MLYNIETNLKMKKKLIYILLLVIVITQSACGKANNKYNKIERKSDFRISIDSNSNTILTRFKTPDGYERIVSDAGTFAYYLQNLTLKPEGTKVYNYDGSLKKPDNVYEAVVDIDVGERDLQQCADAIMRLRAEFLYSQERYNEIHFNFTNGFNAEYSKWRDGYRIKLNGNKASWIKSSEESISYESFRNYLEIVFMYAGTLSLSKELKHTEIKEMKTGDVFIFGGAPGHAVIIVDMAVNKQTGVKIFMLAQSYMPAQDIQILKNPNDISLSPWYNVNFGDILITPEWKFSKDELKSF